MRQRLFALAYTDLASPQSFWGFAHLCSPPHHRRQGYKHCTIVSSFTWVLGTCTQAFTLERQVSLSTELSPQTHIQLSGLCLFVVAVVCLLFLIKQQQNPHLGRSLCRTSPAAGASSCLSLCRRIVVLLIVSRQKAQGSCPGPAVRARGALTCQSSPAMTALQPP